MVARHPEAVDQPVRIVRNLILIVLALVLLPYLITPFYKVGHPVSALMAWRWVTGSPVEREWRDLAAMSPALPRSVVASEDAKFCSHKGIDWNSLQDAIDDAQDGEASGGGSTISQQVAKNLFLWPGRSYHPQGRSKSRWRCGLISCSASSVCWKSI